MSRVATTQRITKYILLSFLCFDFVFSATTETVQRLEDNEDGDIFEAEDFDVDDENIHGEGKDILHDDFFRFTTRKRYIWEDWTSPTRDYNDYGGSSSGSSDFVVYVFVPIFVVLFIVAFAYICMKNMQSENCCSSESNSHSRLSADIFTTVHRPPERRINVTAQVHRPPTRRDLFNEINSNQAATSTIGVNISFVDSPYTSSPESRTEPRNTFGEMPPDYSTVTLNDLVNPNKPAFPMVRKDNETPPPEYGKENPLFK